MRKLALIGVLLAGACVFGIAVAALGEGEAAAVQTKTISSESAATEEVPVPPLLPMTAPVRTADSSAPLRRASSDEPLLLAALYWLVLGGVALRRVRRSVEYEIA